MFHPKFFVSKCFSDISDYVPMLELLRKGNGRGGSWIDDMGAGTEQVQFLRALSPWFLLFQDSWSLLKIGEGTYAKGIESLVLMTQR